MVKHLPPNMKHVKWPDVILHHVNDLVDAWFANRVFKGREDQVDTYLDDDIVFYNYIQHPLRGSHPRMSVNEKRYALQCYTEAVKRNREKISADGQKRLFE